MIKLCIKTHYKTGLKYLCKTKKKNPHKYLGSGKYWKLHLKKHGIEHITEVLLETNSEEELKEFGIAYSLLWNIVESNDWANLVVESGEGGDRSEFIDYYKIDFNGNKNPFYGKKHKPETIEINRIYHIGKSPGNKGVPMTNEQKIKMRKPRRGPNKRKGIPVGSAAAKKAWETKRKNQLK